MFDIGGWEFLLIAILGIIIIGPKELPGAIRTVSMFVRRARELAREFQSGLEEVARQADLDKLGNDIKGMVDPGSSVSDLRTEIENSIDPDRDIGRAMTFDTEWTDDELANFPSADELPERMKAKEEARKAVTASGESPDSPAAERPGTPEGPGDRDSGKTS